MLRFKQYLNEAFNLGIIDPDEVPDIVSTEQDATQLKRLFNYLKRLIDEDIPLIADNNKGTLKIKRVYSSNRKEIEEWMEDNTPDLKIGKGKSLFGDGTVGKDGKKRVNENTQEIMVATLCLMNRNFDTTMSLADAISIIEDAKTYFNDVDGAVNRPELLDQFNDNFDDLGTAISSANAIREITGTITNTYWTGKSWHSDIERFNPTVPGIRDYNSSDIVVKAGTKFYGFSLKKKKRTKDQDPTLINKPITGDKSFLSNILSDSAMVIINNAKKTFFNFIVHKHHNISMRDLSKLPWATRRKGAKSIGRYMNEIPKKKMDGYVKSSSNIFFKKVDSIIITKDNAVKFVEDFLKFVFKFDMPEKLGDEFKDFQFFLLTGIGSKSGDNVVAEPAEVKDLPQTIEVLGDIFARKQLSIAQTTGKKNAFEKDATAAKVFYTVKDASDPILDIEIRYKGSYTANPQFQCVATANFKNMFGKK